MLRLNFLPMSLDDLFPALGSAACCGTCPLPSVACCSCLYSEERNIANEKLIVEHKVVEGKPQT